jgi:hypothetical protein
VLLFLDFDGALRIIGVVPSVLRSDDFPRHREVLAFLKNHNPEKEPRVALDRDPFSGYCLS